jgi:hypothetical protein
MKFTSVITIHKSFINPSLKFLRLKLNSFSPSRTEGLMILKEMKKIASDIELKGLPDELFYEAVTLRELGVSTEDLRYLFATKRERYS